MGAILNNTVYEMPITVNSDICTFGNIKISQLMKLHEKIGELHLNVFGTESEKLRKTCGAAFIFTKCNILVHRPPLENEEIILKTWCSELKGVRFTRNYQTFDKIGNALTEAKCEVTTIDVESRKIIRPSAIPGFDCFLYNNEQENSCEKPQKIELPDDLQFVGVKKIETSDFDDNGHVNNTVYADIMCEFLHEGFNLSEIKGFNINFISEVLDCEKMSIYRCDTADGLKFLGKLADREVFRGQILV